MRCEGAAQHKKTGVFTFRACGRKILPIRMSQDKQATSLHPSLSLALTLSLPSPHLSLSLSATPLSSGNLRRVSSSAAPPSVGLLLEKQKHLITAETTRLCALDLEEDGRLLSLNYLVSLL